MDYIGIDIGGTKCAVVKGNVDTGVREKIGFPTTTPDGTIREIFSAVRKLMPAEAIGISCGGPLDEKKGVIMSPPNLPGWDNVPITAMLEAEFGIKAYLCNDANACALAEWRFGAGKGTENMVFLTFGTGLGAGLILNGKLYTGAGGNAGEVGHIRLAKSGPVGYGKEGSFEGFCSGGGIKKLAEILARRAFDAGKHLSYAKTEADLDALNTKRLAELAKSGDRDALKVFEISAKRLGQGLSVIIDVLNPEAIVIGSVYARCEELFEKKMLKIMEKEALCESLALCKVLPAELGDEVGDVAALCVAIEASKRI